ncbi:ATP-binding protein [Streptomyces sp. NBC_00536]|uniref:ATP-binding protein n=1 Tax=Streptomyces sp. NBC_00536 TaxID=2975769 RepID=UPI002E805A6D|nr:ATP-binding protein [Streptomyces sp. NBC_00536]WUC78783.1 ATP-binding protein [Streptomyces sp. NBC_00536]
MGFTVGEHSAGCAVVILLRPKGLRVEVSDGSASPPRPAADPAPLADGGRGLLLVEAVTDRWGTYATATGKTVWFECDHPARRRSPRGTRPWRPTGQ